MGFKFLLVLAALAAYTQATSFTTRRRAPILVLPKRQSTYAETAKPTYGRGYIRSTAQRGSTYGRQETGYAPRSTGYDGHGTGSLLGRRDFDRHSGQGYGRDILRGGSSYDAGSLVGQVFGRNRDSFHQRDTFGRHRNSRIDCNCLPGEECEVRNGLRRCVRVSGYSARGGRRPLTRRCGRKSVSSKCLPSGSYGTVLRASFIGGACTRRTYLDNIYCRPDGALNNIFVTLEDCRRECENGY